MFLRLRESLRRADRRVLGLGVVSLGVHTALNRLEPGSVKILESPSPGFVLPTKRWALRARFRPARLQGRAVRVLVNLPVDFSASTSGG